MRVCTCYAVTAVYGRGPVWLCSQEGATLTDEEEVLGKAPNSVIVAKKNTVWPLTTQPTAASSCCLFCPALLIILAGPTIIGRCGKTEFRALEPGQHSSLRANHVLCVLVVCPGGHRLVGPLCTAQRMMRYQNVISFKTSRPRWFFMYLVNVNWNLCRPASCPTLFVVVFGWYLLAQPRHVACVQPAMSRVLLPSRCHPDRKRKTYLCQAGLVDVSITASFQNGDSHFSWCEWCPVCRLPHAARFPLVVHCVVLCDNMLG